ncbi:mCG1043924, partial [Mus musculus]
DCFKAEKGDWKDGSEVKSTGCSSRGPEFNSQQPHGGSQPSIIRSGVLFWPAGIYTDISLFNALLHTVHKNLHTSACGLGLQIHVYNTW